MGPVSPALKATTQKFITGSRGMATGLGMEVGDIAEMNRSEEGSYGLPSRIG
jgi:hypothetical protein